MRPEDIGLTESNLVLGKHSGRHALKDKLSELGYDLGENALNDVFVRFKSLADRKKEIYDEDLIALMDDTRTNTESDRIQVKSLRIVCGTDGPQTADITLEIDGVEHKQHATGDGPIDAAFNTIKALVPHKASLKLYQVNAVTQGTDAQAEVSVRLEEGGKIVTGHAADTDTMVASVRAYTSALNRLLVRREKNAPANPIEAAE